MSDESYSSVSRKSLLSFDWDPEVAPAGAPRPSPHPPSGVPCVLRHSWVRPQLKFFEGGIMRFGKMSEREKSLLLQFFPYPNNVFLEKMNEWMRPRHRKYHKVIQAPRFTSCVTSGHLLDFSASQLPYLENVNNYNTYLIGLLWEPNKYMKSTFDRGRDVTDGQIDDR